MMNQYSKPNRAHRRPVEWHFSRLRYRGLFVAVANALTFLGMEAVAATAGPASFEASFLGSELAGMDLSRFEHGSGLPVGDYDLDIFVNKESRGREQVRVVNIGEHRTAPCLTAAMLRGWKVRLPDDVDGDQSACVDLSVAVPLAGAVLKASSLELLLSVPHAAVVTAPRGFVDPAQWDMGVTAATLDYSLNAFRRTSTRGQEQASAFLRMNSGLNLGAWRLRNNSSVNWNNRGGIRANAFSSNARRDLIPWRSELIVGQAGTTGELFDPLSFLGLQVRSDDRMLPDSMAGFAPVVRGVARSNAKITIRQNGYIVYEAAIAPGAFEINDLFPSGFDGDLEVTVTESDGSESQFTVPFASVPQLLRPGRVRYSALVGELRGVIGGKRLTFAEGTYQQGLSNALTAYGGVQAATHSDYASIMGGIAVNTAMGAFSTDISYARARTRPGGPPLAGQSIRATYSTSLPSAGTSVAVAALRHSSSGYFSLPDAALAMGWPDTHSRVRSVWQRKNTLRMTLNQSLGGAAGALFISGSSNDYWTRDGSETTYQIGYSNQWRSLSYSLLASRTRDASSRSDRLVNLSLGMPLGAPSGASRRLWVNYLHGKSGDSRRVEISGMAGAQARVSYNASVADGSARNRIWNAGATYRAPYATMGGSISQASGTGQQSASISGGLVVHRHGLTFAPALSETIGIVSARGASGARLPSSGQSKVDGRGYAIATYLRPYRQNEVRLDPAGAKALVDLDSSIRRVAPRAGAVVWLDYASENSHVFLVRLDHDKKRRVPFGAQVTNASGALVGSVAQGQVAYAKGGASGDLLTARWTVADESWECNFIVPGNQEAPGEEIGAATCIGA